MINKKGIQDSALQLVTRQLPTGSYSINNVSPEREALKGMTEKAILNVLKQFDWTFAQKRDVLKADKIYTTDEDKLKDNPNRYIKDYFGWKSKYKLPNNYIGCLVIYNSQWENLESYTNSDNPMWWVEGKYVLTKTYARDDKINISYTYYDTNELTLPTPVELCIIYHLAHLIAPALIGSFETSERYYNFYLRTLLEAKTLDARERVPIVANR